LRPFARKAERNRKQPVALSMAATAEGEDPRGLCRHLCDNQTITVE
jgi:hypothetical protein